MPQKTILFADNNLDFLDTCLNFFKIYNYNVILAKNPNEAKGILEKQKIDIAIIDVRLINDEDDEDESGLELARTVAPFVPKIILTRRYKFHPHLIRKALMLQPGGSHAAVNYIDKKEGLQAMLTSIRRVLDVQSRSKKIDTAGNPLNDIVYDTIDNTETFQILHISDLHINDSKKELFDRSVVLEPLIERVKQDQKNNFHPEIIVVTGDIAFKGIKAEYDLAKVFFDDLLAALDLDNNRLFVVPGNHDVNREKYRPTAVLRYDNMRALNDELENYRKDLLKGMLDYFNFTDTYLPHLKSIHGRLIPFVNTFDAKCGKRIGLVGLNSAWMCRKSDDKGTIAIGEFQVTRAMEELEEKGEVDLQVVLFHHPLDWLWVDDKNICRQHLNDSILLSGHLHDVAGGYLNDLNGSIYQFQAGGAYLGTKSGWPGRFHYITHDWGVNEIRLDFRRFVKNQRKWSVDSETGDDGKKVFEMIGRGMGSG